MTVLLVEDDPDVRSMLESYFEKLDRVALDGKLDRVALDLAWKGSEALGRSVSSQYDLILLDLHLPDIGGLDILPVLRGSQPTAVIAVISGFTDLVTEEDFDMADVIIPKPFELTVIDELVLATREISERRARIRDLGIS